MATKSSEPRESKKQSKEKGTKYLQVPPNTFRPEYNRRPPDDMQGKTVEAEYKTEKRPTSDSSDPTLSSTKPLSVNVNQRSASLEQLSTTAKNRHPVRDSTKSEMVTAKDKTDGKTAKGRSSVGRKKSTGATPSRSDSSNESTKHKTARKSDSTSDFRFAASAEPTATETEVTHSAVKLWLLSRTGK